MQRTGTDLISAIRGYGSMRTTVTIGELSHAASITGGGVLRTEASEVRGLDRERRGRLPQYCEIEALSMSIVTG